MINNLGESEIPEEEPRSHYGLSEDNSDDEEPSYFPVGIYPDHAEEDYSEDYVSSKFIIHCDATVQQKMKMAFHNVNEKDLDTFCEALALLRFLENEYLTDEDYVTGRKEFEPDHVWSIYTDYGMDDDCGCKSQIQAYEYLVDN